MNQQHQAELTQTLPISAIIITDSANHIFEKSLASVQFCQQVLVADNNSGNKWQELSTRYKFDLISLSQTIADFSQVRNKLASQAKYNWILFIDSDEFFPNQNQAYSVIKKSLHLQQRGTALEKTKAFKLTRQDVYQQRLLKHGEAKQEELIRLYDKRFASFTRPVHEVLELHSNKHRTESLAIKIIHWAHKDAASFLQTINHYSFLEAQYRTKQTANNPDFLAKVEISTQLLFFPPAKFFFNFILKLGFLDGLPGLVYASLMSFHSLLVRIYWWELLFLNDYQQTA